VTGPTGPVVTTLVGLVALTVPVPGSLRRPLLGRVSVFVLGLAAFAFVARRPGLIAAPPSTWGAAAVVVAAIAEEALFRRTIYAWLAQRSAFLAVAVGAVAFAAVHVPAYGTGSVWVNLGAGAVLGWQRWASGSWGVPAATHVAANLMQIGW
jgi:membrane protease YdiL (CAAX protease family)